MADVSHAPLQWDDVVDMFVSIICAGLKEQPMSMEMQEAKKRLYTNDGNIGAGKTMLLDDAIRYSNENGRPAIKIAEQAPKEISQLFYLGLKEKEKNGVKNPYAALAQMFFSAQRSQINQFGNAIAGRTNDYGFPDFPWGSTAKEVYTDRSRIGDTVFVAANWLSKDIDDNELRAIAAAAKTFPTFSFDVAVYLDCSSSTAKKRNEARAKANPERAHEADIPLSYFASLRLIHYIFLRECALRGANILVLDNTKYLTGKQLVEEVSSPLDAKAVKKIWQRSPKLDANASEEAVSEAFASVLSGYAAIRRSSFNPHEDALVKIENPKIPYIELIIAAMRAGKSTEVIRRAGVYKAANKRVKIVKPVIDDRWEAPGAASPEIITHDKTFRREAVAVDNLSDLTFTSEDTDVVIIDEAQFFGDQLIPYMLKHHWFHFIVAGLPSTSNLKPFGQVLACATIASKVTHLNGVCQKCGSFNAAFSPALIKKNSEILVGSEQYGTSCHACYTLMNVN